MSRAAPQAGRLFGVGVGPGDPELVTVKAAKIIGSAAVVAFFAKKGARGNARATVEPWLGAGCIELPLHYPLTTEAHFCDPAYITPLRGFYAEATEMIAAHLSLGRDVAVICEGDPFFYGSFMHLFRRLKDHFCVEIVPGVCGMSGCWSAAKTPMAWGDDVLSVLPGTLDRAALIGHLRACDAAVIMKIGANFAKIRAAIFEAERGEGAIYVEHGTGPAEKVLPLADKTDDRAPYFSMILIPGRGRRP